MQTRFQTWLSTYGYLSEVGTDIAVPTWQEQPETFQKMLFKMVNNPTWEPTKCDRNQIKGWRRWRLQQCEQRTIIKGQIGQIYGKLLAHLRWTFLTIETQGLNQGLLQQPGDIFFLEFSEIQQWIRAASSDFLPESLLQKIQQRRQEFEQDTQRQIPAVVYGNLLPTLQPDQLSSPATLLRGIPASVGCVEGTVKICRSLAATSLDPEPSILVVPYTDAGWAPLLLTAKAIITEVGGQLSHGAIIAREYRIPAVMNVPNAMVQLQDGQRVRVDGYRGTVEVLESVAD